MNKNRLLSTLSYLALAAASLLFVLGLVLPVFSLTRMGMFTTTYSIASAAQAALAEGQWLLCAVIVVFSVLFPGYKLYRLFRVCAARDSERRLLALRVLEKTSKWSMLDVFVIAVLVASLKGTSFARIDVHVGLYAFTASVLLTMLLTAALGRRGAPAAAASGS